MEGATKEDINRIEGKIDKLLSDANRPSKLLLNSNDVFKEYGLSDYILRNARKNEGLTYLVITGREILYKREDIEKWLETRKA